MNEEEFTEDLLSHVFRSATDEPIPLLEERFNCLREAGKILDEKFDGSFVNCIYDANQSAAALVNILADEFPCFRDDASFDGRTVRFYKRAQILIADLWACFDGDSYGEFHDIDKITMFAGMSSFLQFQAEYPSNLLIQDYRIPQMLHQLGCLLYSPPLESHIRRLQPIKPGSKWELELRGTSIWCVELIRQEIERQHPESKMAYSTGNSSTVEVNINGAGDAEQENKKETENAEATETDEGVKEDDGVSTTTTIAVLESDKPAKTFGINAILIDFFLYDTAKELENDGRETIPHHRTRSIWY